MPAGFLRGSQSRSAQLERFFVVNSSWLILPQIRGWWLAVQSQYDSEPQQPSPKMHIPAGLKITNAQTSSSPAIWCLRFGRHGWEAWFRMENELHKNGWVAKNNSIQQTYICFVPARFSGFNQWSLGCCGDFPTTMRIRAVDFHYVDAWCGMYPADWNLVCQLMLC